MSGGHSSDEPWWSVQPSSDDDRRHENGEALLEAAADMRMAAEYLRDAATPPAPPKERNWDFSWITKWSKYSPNGVAFKHSLWSAGPAWTIFLAGNRFEFWTASGITLIGFILIGGWHLRVERKLTRLLTWGLPIGLAYYAPVAIVFGLAQILVGG